MVIKLMIDQDQFNEYIIKDEKAYCIYSCSSIISILFNPTE